jgi:hypothetical protein
MHDESV